MAKNFAELLHAAMKIDADRAVGQPGACGDFGAGHAFDETQEEGLTVGVGERADRREHVVGFGSGVRCMRGGGIGRGGIGVEGRLLFGAAVKVNGAMACNGGEPSGKFCGFAKGRKAGEGVEENVVDEVFGIGGRDAGEKDAVNHASVTRVEKAEGGAIAGLRGTNEGVVRRVGGSGHGEEICTGRAEFEECGHAGSIAMNTRLLGRRGGRAEC